MIDKNNLVGIDAEWSHGYGCRMVCLYGKINGKKFEKTLRPGSPKIHVPNLVYFATPMDLYVSRDLVSYDTAIDSALVCNIKDNLSRTRDFKIGRSLKDRTRRLLNYNMQHTMSGRTHNDQALRELTKEEDHALHVHCKEDAKMSYRLAVEVEVELPPQFNEWCSLAVRWIDIMKNGIHLNPKFVDFLKDPAILSERIVGLCVSQGCNAFYVKDDGLIGISEKKMKQWFDDTVALFGWNTRYTPRSWENFAHYQRQKSEFYQLSNSGTPEISGPSQAIYLALTARQLQQKRMPLTDELFQMETPFGQQSGRANPTSHLIQAGTIYRAGIMPRPGKAYISLDIKSQEAIIAAHLSGDKRLQNATDGDIYSEFANIIFGTTGKLKKTDPFRNDAKTIVLAWLYGGSKKTFVLKLGPGTTNRMGENVEYLLSKAFPGYAEWKRQTVIAAIYEGIIHTELDKVPLSVDNRANERQVVNHRIQGSAADMLRHVTVKMLDAGYKVISTLFDGIYLECDLKDADKVAEESRKFMEHACNEVFPVYCKWTVEIQTDQYWALKHPQRTEAGEKRLYFTNGLFEKDYYKLIEQLGMTDIVPQWDDAE